MFLIVGKGIVDEIVDLIDGTVDFLEETEGKVITAEKAVDEVFEILKAQVLEAINSR